MRKNQLTVSRRSFVAAGATMAAAMGLGLSGCGSSSNSMSQGAQGGGELTAAVAYETKNYHPSTTSSALAMGSNWHVVEGLYELNLSTYTPYQALAAGDPVKVSDTEYTVKLRDDAKFSDGTAVTAADVVSSYERIIAQKSLYIPFLTFIESVTASDDSTVDFKLAYPFSLVKQRLSLIKVIPSSATDEELTAMPVGSGPWKYDSIDEKTITFSPNENYNGEFSAFDKSMKWDIIKDDTARTTALQEGSVMVMESVPADMQAQLQSAGVTVDSVQGFNLPFLMFNTKKAPFDDNRVRQAFFYAIDVDKLITNAMSGLAAKATSFLPENHANYHRASTVFDHDTDKAKSLLAEAGVTNLSLTLDTTDHPWITALSAQVKNDLEATGVLKVDIQSQASSSLYANRTDTDNPEFDVVMAPGDPSVFGNDPDLLMNWWYGDNTWTKKRTQWGGSESYEKLHSLMQQAVESDGSTQQTLWNQCFDLIAEQVPLYPLFHRQMLTGYYADRIADYKPIGTTGLNFIGAATTGK